MRSRCLLSLLLFATPSAAQDWTPIDLGTTEDILYVEAPNTAWAWVAGTGGLVVQSDYARMVWNTIDVGTGADQLSVIESVAGQVWTGAGNGVVRRLIGSSWEGRNIPNANEDFTLFTRSSGSSWAVGTGGSIYRTTDGGEGGVLLHTWTGGGDCNPVSVAEAAPARSRYLDVVPNPLHGIGSVAFGGPRTGEFSLELYDVNGRRVQPLIDGSWATGSDRSAVLDVSGLPAGIYFLRLDSGATVSSHRIAVIH